MSKKVLKGLAPVVAAAAFSAMPAVAQATPQFQINGVLAGTAEQDVVQFGTMTLHSSILGDFKCRVLAGLQARNETEKGIAGIESWEPYDCTSTECRGAVLVTPEQSPELVEHPVGKFLEARRQSRYIENLPWSAELISEAGKAALSMRKMKLWIECPQEGFEIPYTGNIAPRFQNGLKNGLSPSHMVFEGKGGHTGFLSSPAICGGCESEEDNLYVSGELTTLGTSEELITAE
jgi:hypothetical protein